MSVTGGNSQSKMRQHFDTTHSVLDDQPNATKIFHLEGNVRVMCRVRPIISNEFEKPTITFKLTENKI